MSDTETIDVSTSLGEEGTKPSGAGAPRTLEEPKQSLRDTIAKEFEVVEDAPKDEKPGKSDDKVEGEKEAEKPEEAKPAEAEKEPVESKEAKEEAKPEKVEKPKAEEEADDRVAAPKRFQADAKEKWANVPRSVQRDVGVMAREYEQAEARYKETSERYENIREFDEHVRNNGGNLRDSLSRVAEIEGLVHSNPIAGLNRVLMEAGPRKPDGSPYNLFELASAISQAGQQRYQQMASQVPQQQQPQQNSEVEQLKAQMADMQRQQLESAVIIPFKQAHPRYEELQDDIAMFLKSGKVPTSLSPNERLEVAYDMAERINPSSLSAPKPNGADPDSRTAESFSGSKSIKSAPGAVSPETEPERGGSISDVIRQEMKRSRAR